MPGASLEELKASRLAGGYTEQGYLDNLLLHCAEELGADMAALRQARKDRGAYGPDGAYKWRVLLYEAILANLPNGATNTQALIDAAIAAEATARNAAITAANNAQTTSITAAYTAADVVVTNAYVAAIASSIAAEVTARNNAITASHLLTLEYRGVIDVSTNPLYPAASKGDLYKITAGLNPDAYGHIGSAGGPYVQAGDFVLCLATVGGGDHSTVGASWGRIGRSNGGTLPGGYTIVGAIINGNSQFNDGTLNNVTINYVNLNGAVINQPTVVGGTFTDATLDGSPSIGNANISGSTINGGIVDSADISDAEISRVHKLTLHSDMFIEVTASRDLTDDDNGRILYLPTNNSFTLTANGAALTRPFACKLLTEHSTASLAVAGSGGISIVSASSALSIDGNSFAELIIRDAIGILHGDLT